MFWSSRRSNLVRQANFDGSGITDIATSVDTDDIGMSTWHCFITITTQKLLMVLLSIIIPSIGQ